MHGWNPDNLNRLVAASQLSRDALSYACGVCASDLSHICSGRKNPSVSMLIKLSDYFAVPVDYILGRCDPEMEEGIIKDYSRRFQELRRAPWEAYLIGRRNIPGDYIGRTYEAPWPYNLLDDIFGEWDDVITDDQMTGLNRAINMLPERRYNAVMWYYYEGLTLREIGERYELSKERVRQLISEALHALRHPTHANLIRKGSAGADAEREILKRKAELEKEKDNLAAVEAELKRRTAQALNYAEVKAAVVNDVRDKRIADLGLSGRSYNCLSRAYIYTVGDLLDRARKGVHGGLSSIRALGAKSLREILTAIKDLTGEDLFPLYAHVLHITREVDAYAQHK